MTLNIVSPVIVDYPIPTKNIFLMMRFSDTDSNRKITQAIAAQIEDFDLNLLRADMKSYREHLWDNVRSYLDACDLGIAVFEQIDKRDFNPNISLELGYMLAKDKKVLILKEKRLKSLPSDIVARLYRNFDADQVGDSIRSSVILWLKDIGISKSRDEKFVVFVSAGGTCRCAMAKIVLQQALAKRKLPFRLKIISAAKTFGTNTEASQGARNAIIESYGDDLLRDHVVTRLRPGLINDADLILPMEKTLCEGIRDDTGSKVQLLKQFFENIESDIVNPWPDDAPGAAAKYRACLLELRATIEPNVEKLVRVLTR